MNVVSLPYSIFKIVQGLCYPRRTNVFSYGPWDTSDFSTSQNIQNDLTPETDIVIIPHEHEQLEYVLSRSSHIDYKFQIIISSYDRLDLITRLKEIDHAIISSIDGYYAVILHKFAKNSYLGDYIRQGIELDIDQDSFFLPDFDYSKWSQNDKTVTFDSPEGQIDFTVPSSFSLARTSKDLLWIIESVLLSPWHKKYNQPWVPTRRPGNRPGLSFSGGIDSTAALCLMPKDTILLYMERNFESMIKHENAHYFISELEKMGRTVINVQSNHESIRTNYGKNPGFSTDYACMAHLILLADFLDLDSAATGMPLENTYFFHGSSVRDFAESRFWKSYSPMFNYAGLSLYQPVAGCSEIINSQIVKDSPYEHLASSCLRSPNVGMKCETCWKCFRKNIFSNQSWSMSSEISTFLGKRPLKQGLATLYALQIIFQADNNLPPEAKDLQPIIDTDLSFLKHYWPPYIELIPIKYRQFTHDKIREHATPMNINLLAMKENVLSVLRGEST